MPETNPDGSVIVGTVPKLRLIEADILDDLLKSKRPAHFKISTNVEDGAHWIHGRLKAKDNKYLTLETPHRVSVLVPIKHLELVVVSKRNPFITEPPDNSAMMYR